MKGERKYILILVAIFVIMVAVEYNAPKPVNWSASFSKKDKIPYGCYVLFDYLSDIFPGKEISSSNRPLYNTLEDNDEHHTNYIIINEYLQIDTLDLIYLTDYVKKGNSVFIAADSYEGPLADTLKLSTGTQYNLNVLKNDSISLNFSNPSLHSEKNFKYKNGSVENYFTRFDSSRTTILGTNSKDKVTYIKVSFGEGAFYLSTVPYAFTNYNAIKGNNGEYIYRALSCLPVANTTWDEYYKPNTHKEDETPLRFILETPALQSAYYLLIIGLILYIIFEGKRRQRVIPVILPLKNTSLEFVETIGRLYYQKGTNSGIAHEKIMFFFDHIRSTYNINTNILDSSFYESLSIKTLIPVDELKKLFTFINQVQAASAVDESTLMELSNQIETFYHKTK